MFRRQFLAFIILVGLIPLNRWIFATFFDTDYLLWYINSGTFISFGIAFMSHISKDFNADVNTISANPGIYMATYLRYLASQVFLFGMMMRLRARGADTTANHSPDGHTLNQVNAGQAAPSFNLVSSLWLLVESLVLAIWLFILLGVMFLWVTVVVPLQYFVFLICGAPARSFQVSDHRAIIGREGETPFITYLKTIEPYTLTNSLSVLFFAAMKFIVL